MATYGKVKVFNLKADYWEVYKEQLHFYMVANNITDAAKKWSIVLTVCGDQTFKLLRSLVPDGKLDADDITYDSLVGLLKSHYKKKQSVVVLDSTSIPMQGCRPTSLPTTLQLSESSQ